MQKNQTDEGLNFKKRARRRLVGAIALVFLMIIILPMILEDREKSPPQEEIEIIMPDQEGSDLAALDEGANMGEALPDVDVAEKAVTAQVVELPKTEITIINPESKVIEKPKTEKAKVEPKKPAKPIKIKKESVKVASVEKVNNANDKFYVQIGVFSEMANVKKLQSKLDDLGYQSVTEEIATDNGVKTRLRTETFVGRNEAAIALENIKDSGLTGMVVSQK